MKAMVSVPVEFRSPEDIVAFVDIVSKFDYDVDLRCGRYVVDAKSMMSAFTLSSSKNVEMQIHASECSQLITDVAQYICA